MAGGLSMDNFLKLIDWFFTLILLRFKECISADRISFSEVGNFRLEVKIEEREIKEFKCFFCFLFR